jgi:hypothetical protein
MFTCRLTCTVRRGSGGQEEENGRMEREMKKNGQYRTLHTCHHTMFCQRGDGEERR